jgi:tRNA (guanine-N7-)-methyltransferase
MEQPIKSFVRRSGRTTRAQRRALQSHWSRFGIDATASLDLDRIFGRQAPRFLEIGFGMGDGLVQMAYADPERDYLGVDVHEPGIGRLLNQLSALDLKNVRLVRGDAVTLLREVIPGQSLAGILVFFPDPWPKKRHRKRRLIQSAFVSLICDKLALQGRFHVATDWEDYAQDILGTLERESRLMNLAGAGRFFPRPPYRPLTKFERQAIKLNRPVWDLLFEKRL